MNILPLLLRPLARLAILRGWRFSDVTEHLRRSFFDAALDLNGPDATDSKLSLQTGLQRRDIVRLRSAAPAETAATRHPLAEIISRWHAEPTYDTRALPLRGSVSFDSLARSVRKDVHPRTFLDQLIETETVVQEGDHIRLLRQSYQPRTGSDAQLAYLGANVGDHLDVAVRNVTTDADLPEAAVHFEGLSAAAIADLRAYWAEKSLALMHEVETMARAMPASKHGDCRFRAGAYFHDTAQDDAS